MYRIYKMMDAKNRAYVVDMRGNKVYYGTVYQCKNFIKYMEGDDDNAKIRKCRTAIRQKRDRMDAERKAVSESLVHVQG